MPQTQHTSSKSSKWVLIGLFISGLLLLAVFPALSAKKVKDETIEATAMGSDSQMGQNAGISVEIYEYSTPEDSARCLQQRTEPGPRQRPYQDARRWPYLGHRYLGL